MAKLAVGQSWPKGNEDQLQLLAQAWVQSARELDRLTDEIDPATSGVLDSLGGPVAEQFSGFTRQMRTVLPNVAQSVQGIGDLSRNAGVQLEYTKYSLLIQMVFLAYMLWELASLGLPELDGVVITAVRTVCVRILQSLARNVVMGTAFMAGTDVAVQVIQFLKGDRTSWSWDNTLQAVEGGAVGGAFAGVFTEAARFLPPGFGGVLGRQLGVGAATGIATTLTMGAVNGDFGDALTDGLAAASGAIGGLYGGRRGGHGEGSGHLPPARFDLPPMPDFTKNWPGTDGTGTTGAGLPLDPAQVTDGTWARRQWQQHTTTPTTAGTAAGIGEGEEAGAGAGVYRQWAAARTDLPEEIRARAVSAVSAHDHAFTTTPATATPVPSAAGTHRRLDRQATIEQAITRAEHHFDTAYTTWATTPHTTENTPGAQKADNAETGRAADPRTHIRTVPGAAQRIHETAWRTLEHSLRTTTALLPEHTWDTPPETVLHTIDQTAAHNTPALRHLLDRTAHDDIRHTTALHTFEQHVPPAGPTTGTTTQLTPTGRNHLRQQWLHQTHTDHHHIFGPPTAPITLHSAGPGSVPTTEPRPQVATESGPAAAANDRGTAVPDRTGEQAQMAAGPAHATADASLTDTAAATPVPQEHSARAGGDNGPKTPDPEAAWQQRIAERTAALPGLIQVQLAKETAVRHAVDGVHEAALGSWRQALPSLGDDFARTFSLDLHGAGITVERDASHVMAATAHRRIEEAATAPGRGHTAVHRAAETHGSLAVARHHTAVAVARSTAVDQATEEARTLARRAPGGDAAHVQAVVAAHRERVSTLFDSLFRPDDGRFGPGADRSAFDTATATWHTRRAELSQGLPADLAARPAAPDRDTAPGLPAEPAPTGERPRPYRESAPLPQAPARAPEQSNGASTSGSDSQRPRPEAARTARVPEAVAEHAAFADTSAPAEGRTHEAPAESRQDPPTAKTATGGWRTADDRRLDSLRNDVNLRLASLEWPHGAVDLKTVRRHVAELPPSADRLNERAVAWHIAGAIAEPGGLRLPGGTPPPGKEEHNGESSQAGSSAGGRSQGLLGDDSPAGLRDSRAEMPQPAPLSHAVVQFGQDRDGAQGLTHIDPVSERTAAWLQDRIAAAIERDEPQNTALRAMLAETVTPRAMASEWARLLSDQGLPVRAEFGGRTYHAAVRLRLSDPRREPSPMEEMPDGPPLAIQRWAFGVGETGTVDSIGDLRPGNFTHAHTWPLAHRGTFRRVTLSPTASLTYNQATRTVATGATVQPMTLLRSLERSWAVSYQVSAQVRLTGGLQDTLAPAPLPEVWSPVAGDSSEHRLTTWFPAHLMEDRPDSSTALSTAPADRRPAPLRTLVEDVPLFAVETVPHATTVLHEVHQAFAAHLAALSEDSAEELHRFFSEGNLRGNLPLMYGGGHSSPPLYDRNGRVLGHLSVRARMLEEDPAHAVVGPPSRNSELEVYVLRSLRVSGSTSVANSASFGGQLSLGFAIGTPDPRTGSEPFGGTITLNGSLQHQATHTLSSGGSARTSHSLRTDRPLMRVQARMVLDVTLMRPGAVPVRPPADSRLAGRAADDSGYPVILRVPSAASVSGVPAQPRHLPAPIRDLTAPGVLTTPLRVQGADPLFAHVERFLSEHGFLPPLGDDGASAAPLAVGSGSRLVETSLHAQRLANLRRLEQTRSQIGQRGALDEMLDGGYSVEFERPTVMGVQRVSVRLTVTRRYSQGEGTPDAGVVHTGHLNGVQTLNYTGSTITGDEQLRRAPLQANVGPQFGATNILSDPQGVTGEYSYTWQPTDMVTTDSSSGSGQEFYALSRSEADAGVHLFTVPVTHHVQLSWSHGPVPEPRHENGEVSLAVPVDWTLDTPDPSPIAGRPTFHGPGERLDPPPAEAVRGYEVHDDPDVNAPASGPEVTTAEDGQVVRHTGDAPNPAPAAPAERERHLPETAFVNRMRGGAALHEAVDRMLGAVARDLEAAAAAELHDPTHRMPGVFPRDEPRPAALPTEGPQGIELPEQGGVVRQDGDAEQQQERQEPAAGGWGGALWNSAGHLTLGAVRWTARQVGDAWQWTRRTAVGENALAQESTPRQALDFSLSPHHLVANAHRIFDDSYVVESAATSGVLAGTDVTVEVRGFLHNVRRLPSPGVMEYERWIQSMDASAHTVSRTSGHTAGLTLSGNYGPATRFVPTGRYAYRTTDTTATTVNDNASAFRVSSENDVVPHRFEADVLYRVTVRTGLRNLVTGTAGPAMAAASGLPGAGRLLGAAAGLTTGEREMVVRVPAGVEFLLSANDLLNHPEFRLDGGPDVPDAPPLDRRLPPTFVASGGQIGFGSALEVHPADGRSALQNTMRTAIESIAPGATRPGHAAYLPGVLSRINEHGSSLGMRTLLHSSSPVAFRFVHRSFLGPLLVRVEVRAVPAADLTAARGRAVPGLPGLDTVLGHSDGRGSSLPVPGSTRQARTRTSAHELDGGLTYQNGGHRYRATASGTRQSETVQTATASEERRAWQQSMFDNSEFALDYRYEVAVTATPMDEALIVSAPRALWSGMGWLADRTGLAGAAAQAYGVLPETARHGIEGALGLLPRPAMSAHEQVDAQVVLRFNGSETPRTTDPAPVDPHPGVVGRVHRNDPTQPVAQAAGELRLALDVPDDLRNLLSDAPWQPERPFQIYHFGGLDQLTRALHSLAPGLGALTAGHGTTMSDEGRLVRLTQLAAAGVPVPVHPAGLTPHVGRSVPHQVEVHVTFHAPRIVAQSNDVGIDRVQISTRGSAAQTDVTHSPALSFTYSGPVNAAQTDRLGPGVPVAGERTDLGHTHAQSAPVREMLRFGTRLANRDQGTQGALVQAVAVVHLRRGDQERWVTGPVVLRATELPPQPTPTPADTDTGAPGRFGQDLGEGFEEGAATRFESPHIVELTDADRSDEDMPAHVLTYDDPASRGRDHERPTDEEFTAAGLTGDETEHDVVTHVPSRAELPPRPRSAEPAPLPAVLRRPGTVETASLRDRGAASPGQQAAGERFAGPHQDDTVGGHAPAHQDDTPGRPRIEPEAIGEEHLGDEVRALLGLPAVMDLQVRIEDLAGLAPEPRALAQLEAGARVTVRDLGLGAPDLARLALRHPELEPRLTRLLNDLAGGPTAARNEAMAEAPPPVAVDIFQQHVVMPFVIGTDDATRAVREPYEQAVADVARALRTGGEQAAHDAAERALRQIPGAEPAKHRPGIIAGGKKKKNGNRPQQPHQPAPQNQTTPPTQTAGPSNTAQPAGQAVHRTTDLPSEVVAAVRQIVTGGLTSRPAPHQEALMSDVLRVLERVPAPADLPMSAIVGSVDIARAMGSELAGHVLAHPSVVYAVARQPQLYSMLIHAPVSAALDAHPAVLGQLTALPGSWFQAQGPAFTQVLLRPGVLDGLEGDPELQELLFNRSTTLLRNLNGDLNLARHARDISSDVTTLVDQVPELAAAVLSLGEQAPEALWQLGAESTLTSALLSRFSHYAHYSIAFFRTLLTDDRVRTVLRTFPEQNQVALLSERTLAAVAADPEVLRALEDSPSLTDVLEITPSITERLLADREAMEAAVANPNVTVALSYHSDRYDAVPNEELAQVLAAEAGPAEAQQAQPLELTERELNGPVPVLLRRLTQALPAMRTAVTGLPPNTARRLLENVRMLRLLARNPQAVSMPHTLRQLLTLAPDLALPEDDTAALAIAVAAARHWHVHSLYLSTDGRASHQLAVNHRAAVDPDFREALLRFPAISAISYADVRALQIELPLTTLSRDPWVATLLIRSPEMQDYLRAPDNAPRRAMQAGGGPLSTLLYRHTAMARELTSEQWEQVTLNLTAAPGLLPALTSVFSTLTPAHWTRLLTDDRLFQLLAERMETPTARTMVQVPSLLRAAVARPDFTDAWQDRPEEFDALASAVLRRIPGPEQMPGATPAEAQDAVSSLGRAVVATGHQIITPDGFVLDPERSVVVARLLPHLRDGDAPETVLRAQADADTPLPDEVIDRYRDLLTDDTLRQTALRRPHLAEYLLFAPDLLDLLRTRPSMLELIERDPEVLPQLMKASRLPALLTHDDAAYGIYRRDPEARVNFRGDFFAIYHDNPDYVVAFDRASHWLMQGPYTQVDVLAMGSPALSRAIAADPGVLGAFLHSPDLTPALSAAGEPVIRAITAAPGRLEGAAEDPATVTALAAVPGLADALAERPDLAASAAQWRELTGNGPLLKRLTAHPNIAASVLTPDVLPVAMTAPALVTALAHTPAEVHRQLTAPTILRLITRHPGLADDLADQKHGHALRAALIGLRGLPALLTDRPDLLTTLRQRPDLVKAIRANRSLIDEATARTPAWHVAERHPELAPHLNSRLRNNLQHYPDAARTIAQHPTPLDPTLLPRTLRRPGILPLITNHPDIATALLSQPELQQRALEDRDFVATVQRAAAAGPERLTTLLAAGGDHTLWAQATGRTAPRLTPAAPPVIMEPPTSPARSEQPQPVPAVVPGLRSALPAEVVDLLTGPRGDEVAERIATNPELLPLLTAHPSLAEDITQHPDHLDTYTARPFFENHLPDPDHIPLTNDPTTEEQLLGHTAFQRHFDAFLESVDIAPGDHYTAIRTATLHTWNNIASTLQNRLAERHTERHTRLTTFRPESASTWQLSGRIHFAGRVQAEDFTPLQHAVLDRAATWGEGIREPLGQRRIHMPLHAHLDNGSGGAAFFPTLAHDGLVDLVVYARSTARSDNNQYRWTGSSRYTSGPPSAEDIANHPLLTQSHDLINQTRKTTGETTGDRTADATAASSGKGKGPVRPRRTPAAELDGLAAADRAQALATATRGYHAALDAARTPTPETATRLLRAGRELHQEGADPFGQAWEALADDDRTTTEALVRTALPDPTHTDAWSAPEWGAVAVAHRTGGDTLARDMAQQISDEGAEAVDIFQQHVVMPFVIGTDDATRAVREPYEQAVADVARALRTGGEQAAHDAAERALRQIPGAEPAKHRPGIIAAGKKKKNGNRPQQPHQPAPQNQTTPPTQTAGPSNTAQPAAAGSFGARQQRGSVPPREPAVTHTEDTATSLPPAVTLAVQEAVTTELANWPATHQEAVQYAVHQLLERVPAPADLSMSAIVRSVDWVLRASSELAEQVLPYPDVVYATARQPLLYTMLMHAPALGAALNEHHGVLSDLIAVPVGWHQAQDQTTAQILLRPGLLERLESVPELRAAVFLRSRTLLRNLDGDLDLLGQVREVSYDVMSLADRVPAFAEAAISLGKKAPEALWELGAESTLTSALMSRLNRRARFSAEFFRTLLTDRHLRLVLRTFPEQNQVALLSERTLAAVAADPEVLRALEDSPWLTDVLEITPSIAERLLADREAMEAAVANPNVTTALSYHPDRYDAVPNEELAQVLAAETGPAEAQQAQPLELTERELNGPVPVLLRRLTQALPAMRTAVSGLPTDAARRLLENVRMLRLLARNPQATGLPHVLRQLLALSPRLTLPENDTAALAIAVAAARHGHLNTLYLSNDGRASYHPIVNERAATDPVFRDALLRFPAISALAYADARMLLHDTPLTTLARDPWAVSLLIRAPEMRPYLGESDTPPYRAMAASGGLLRGLLYRHTAMARELTSEQWEQVTLNLTAAPGLLPALTSLFGLLTPAHWTRLLTDDRLFQLLAERMETPTVRGLLRVSTALRAAVARPDFTDAWQDRPEEFDALATTMLHRAQSPDSSPEERQDAANAFGRAVVATGPAVITQDGFVLDPERSVVVARLLPHLRDGDAPETVLRAQADADTPLPDEVMDRYRDLLTDDTLRQTALRRPHLAEYLLFAPDLLDLLRTRPSMLELIERDPEVLRQVLDVPGLSALLDHDDAAYAIYRRDQETRLNFVESHVATIRQNPDYLLAFDRAIYQLIQQQYSAADAVAMGSPALSRAIAADPGVLGAFLHSPDLTPALSAAGEPVIRAITAAPGRLEGAAEDPATVTALAAVPGLADALAERPDLAASAAQWRELTGNGPLLKRLTAHPNIAASVLTPDVLPVAMTAPALVTALAHTPAEVHRQLTAPTILRLITRHPGLADDLADQKHGHALRAALIGLRGLPALLTDRPDLLTTLRQRPDLVKAIRANRSLIDEATARTPAWHVAERHPELAPHLNSRLRNNLQHYPDAARTIAQHPTPLDPTLLPRTLRRPGILPLITNHPDIATALLSQPELQQRALEDRDFVATVQRAAAAGPERLTTLLAAGGDHTLWAQATGRTAPETGTQAQAQAHAQAQVAEGSRVREEQPDTAPSVPHPAAAPVAVSQPRPLLPAEVVDLLTGPRGDEVAERIATNPELLPLLTAHPSLAEDITQHPDHLDTYTARPFFENHLPDPDHIPLTNDPTTEEQLLGHTAFQRHFDAFLESVDIAPGDHYTAIRTATLHTWNNIASTLQNRLAERHTERHTRLTTFRPESASTWQLSGRIHFAGRVQAEDFTPLQHAVLDRAATWGEGIREPLGQRRIHMPLHAHLDNGSGGAAFFPTLAHDGLVDLVVYARSTARSDNNQYRWTGSSRYTSGPPSAEDIANHPLLTQSHDLINQTRKTTGESAVDGDRGTGRSSGNRTTDKPANKGKGAVQPRRTAAADAEELAAADRAQALAAATRDYRNALDAARAGAPDEAAPLLRAGHALREEGADPFGQAWEALADDDRTTTEALVRTALPDPTHTDAWSPTEWGAVAVAHRTGGDTLARDMARQVAGETGNQADTRSGARAGSGPSAGLLKAGGQDTTALADRPSPDNHAGPSTRPAPGVTQRATPAREFAAAVADMPALRGLPADLVARAVDIYGQQRAREFAIGDEPGSVERQEAEAYWRDVAEVARTGQGVLRSLGGPRHTDPELAAAAARQSMRDLARELAERHWRTVGVTSGDERDMVRHRELTAESPRFRDELKTWVESALRSAGRNHAASHEEITATWQRLPRAQRRLPLSPLARAIATALDGRGTALRGGGGGVEAEFTEVLRLARGKGTPGNNVRKPIARGDGFEVTVETKEFYRGSDGRLFRRKEDAEKQTGKVREVTLAIPEFVAGVHKVLPSEDRIDDGPAFVALRRLEERFAVLGPEREFIPVEEAFPAEDGWEVTDLGQGAWIERRVIGDWQGAHVHYTLGVPVHGLREFLEHVRDHTWRDESRGYLTRAHLTDGLSFGDELASRYAVWREHRDGGLASWALPAEQVAALLADDPVVTALRGYGALLHDQVAALVHFWIYEGLNKVNAAVLSRNSMSDVLAALPQDARVFLAADALPAMAAMERRIRARLPEYDREYARFYDETAPASLFDLTISDEQDRTIREYTWAGLVQGGSRPMAQDYAFSIHDLPELDTEDGNAALPLVVIEVRSYGERHVSVDETAGYYDRLKQTAADVHAKAQQPASGEAGWAGLRQSAAPGADRPAAVAVQRALRSVAAAEEGRTERLIDHADATVIAAALPLLDGPQDAQIDRLSLSTALDSVLQRLRLAIISYHRASLDVERAEAAIRDLAGAVLRVSRPVLPMGTRTTTASSQRRSLLGGRRPLGPISEAQSAAVPPLHRRAPVTTSPAPSAMLRHTVDSLLADLRWSGGPVDDALVHAVQESLGDGWQGRHPHAVGAEIAARLNAVLGPVPQAHEGIVSRYELRREVLAALSSSGLGTPTVTDEALRGALTRLGPTVWTLPAAELGRRVAAVLSAASRV
ncbi:hypothetical protein OG552_29835 [Streptomyces sp. NBC_01476]|uniref:WXG100-like domain-containing protein n=1 Tax=Streptomyces sp. NBC_01476 TaxID=2903881 RepID=UPI002E35F25B|nr:hypothetical protein [Streptomyces sp. NBC_01476]